MLGEYFAFCYDVKPFGWYVSAKDGIGKRECMILKRYFSLRKGL